MRKPDRPEDDVIPELDNPFLPARGLTQGAPESTMGWVVFFDPLLAALNKVQKYPFYIRQRGSHLAEQDPTCYADDLHLIASCRECTVECNKVISAFAAMFGIKFAPKKLRAITTAKEPGVMILYDWEWKEICHPFGTVEESIKSLGLTYNLRYDWGDQFDELLARFKAVGVVLRRKHASTMTRGILQKSSSTSKIGYTAQFSPFTKEQHQLLSAALVSPLREQKAIGSRIATNVMINEQMGGFMPDIHKTVQLAKSRLVTQAMKLGGATARSINGLLARAARRGYLDPTATSARIVVQSKIRIKGRATYHWWAHSLVEYRESGGDSMVLTELVSNPVQHVSTVLSDLSTDAEDFLENFDITYIEELIELTGAGTELSPRVVPWIANKLSPPAYEIKARVEEWLERHRTEPLWTIPVVRDQMFCLPNGHYFLVAGIIPTGEISGRYFYHTRKRGRTYGPDGTLFLKPDWRPSFSSQPRGSGWDTLLPPDGLAAAHRVLVIRSPGRR
jgi:hypothetical protein